MDILIKVIQLFLTSYTLLVGIHQTGTLPHGARVRHPKSKSS